MIWKKGSGLMPSVQLIDYTGKGRKDPASYAAGLLLFAKSTRLDLNPDLLESYQSLDWHDDEVLMSLRNIAKTIPSSWEFLHLTFLVSDVSRAFTHQFVRTRTASFAQQSLRVVDIGDGFDVAEGPSLSDKALQLYRMHNSQTRAIYSTLKELGVSIEDARGILPTNIKTNILMSCNFRTFVEIIRKRSSPRTQIEYLKVVQEMKAAVENVWPWAQFFTNRNKDAILEELQEAIEDSVEGETKTKMFKLLDELRNE
jgi:flavin-dependent thymidylate synthase